MTKLTRKLPPVEKLKVAEAREFRGGLNTFDTPLNLSTRYVTAIRNLYPDTNGRLRMRYGTSYFADAVATLDEIVNIEYFNTAIIAVGKNGKVVSIDGTGTVTVRWDTAIAAALPGTPSAWSTGLTSVNFTQFNGKLIICNGVDKPLTMTAAYAVTYLSDAGTGSNVNVPRAKYCVTHGNYLILACTPTDKTTLSIGMKGTAGTFVGDPGVDNDAVDFVTSTYVNRGSPDITGLGSFRDTLIVSFTETLLAMKLGNYNADGDHLPTVEDVIENHGAISHRCIVPLGDDILFLDQAGMASVQRALITATLSPVRESTLIGEDMQAAMAIFTPAQLDQYVFAIHDRIAQHILFFIPKSATVEETTDNNVFVYCFDRSQKFRAWSYFDQMRYRCGTRTTEGRVFLASGTKIYYYHNQYDPLFNDYSVNGQQLWQGFQPWNDAQGWIEASQAVGLAIPYNFELPWTNMKQPGKLKMSKYVGFSMEGDGVFTLQMYVDGFPQPELSMQFDMTKEPAGTDIAVRPSHNAQLYAWPHKFDRMRFRVEGSSDDYIAFVSIELHYLVGSIRR